MVVVRFGWSPDVVRRLMIRDVVRVLNKVADAADGKNEEGDYEWP